MEEKLRSDGGAWVSSSFPCSSKAVTVGYVSEARVDADDGPGFIMWYPTPASGRGAVSSMAFVMPEYGLYAHPGHGSALCLHSAAVQHYTTPALTARGTDLIG